MKGVGNYPELALPAGFHSAFIETARKLVRILDGPDGKKHITTTNTQHAGLPQKQTLNSRKITDDTIGKHINGGKNKRRENYTSLYKNMSKCSTCTGKAVLA